MCDSLVALAPVTHEGVTLFAKNSDRPPQETQAVEWSLPRREVSTRTTYIDVSGHSTETIRSLISRPAWCWGAEHGVNEAGLAIGNHTIYTTLDPRGFPPALIGMDLVRLALERASTAADAVEVMTSLLEEYGQGGSGHDVTRTGRERPYWSSFLVADPVSAWMLETSGRTWQAQPVDSVAAMSNRTCIAAFDAEHRHPSQPVAWFVDPRLAASRAVLDRGAVSRDAIMQHLRSHDTCVEDGWSVCMHVGDVEATTASMVAELRPGRPVAWMLTGSPCQHEYQPIEL